MNILETIADAARERVALSKQNLPLDALKERISSIPKGEPFLFEKALSNPELSFICECKKASPSRGLIAEYFPYLQIAKEYEEAGASCISVLTEPKWFLGSDQYLEQIAKEVSIPCLRKDFIVDEYMIYEAKLLGAQAVLLICSITKESELGEYLSLCDRLGLSALIETHDEKEMKSALRVGARLVGVNNRNLKDFSVNTENSRKMRDLVPDDVLFVSESGVKDERDIAKLKEIGVDAVLIGEALMKAPDKKALLSRFRGVK